MKTTSARRMPLGRGRLILRRTFERGQRARAGHLLAVSEAGGLFAGGDGNGRIPGSVDVRYSAEATAPCPSLQVTWPMTGRI